MVASFIPSIPNNPLRRAATATALGALLAFALCVPGNLMAANFFVVVQDDSFNPNSVTINVGDTVNWTNDGSMDHSVTSDTGVFNRQDLNPGETFPFTFPNGGDFPYHCRFHGAAGGVGMSGVIHVTAPTPPTITSAPPTPATRGVAYTYMLTATGTMPITWSSTGAFPNGLTLNATTGELSGTPTVAGAFPGITVTAANSSAQNASQSFTMTVYDPPVFTSAAPPGGAVGAAYTSTYTATGSATITFTVTSGGLPPGLTLTAGVLSGTPTTGGTYNGIVSASNPSSVVATQPFSILIKTAPVIISAPPIPGVQNSVYSYQVVATGSAPITYSAPGLPTGLTISAGTGLISGTPTATGTATGTITANNGVNPNATQNFSINIGTTAVAPVITSAAPPSPVFLAPYSFTYTASGTATIAYQVTTGALPAGLTLSSGGIISGKANAAGTFSGVVTASNGTGPASTQAFNFTIAGGGGGGTGSRCGSGAKASLLMLGLLLLLRRFRA